MRIKFITNQHGGDEAFDVERLSRSISCLCHGLDERVSG